MLQIKYHSGPSPGPKLRATEQRAGGGPLGAPKKQPGTAIQEAEIPASAARCQTEIEGRGAVLWRGPARCPEKAAWDRYLGGAKIPARTLVCCQTEIEGRGSVRWVGPPRHPEKAPGTSIRGAKIPVRARARCQTEIEGRGAVLWRGPPRCPEKAAWDRYSEL